MRRIGLLVVILLLMSLSGKAQKELLLSQYMHNRYAFNTAFAGSRQGLSVFGAFRKQWVGIPGSPEAQLFTAHMPLKNLNIALGVQLYNETIATSSQSGITFSYTYRFHVDRTMWMGLSLSGGLSTFSTKWSQASLEDPNDPLFANNESSLGPQVGLAWSLYNERFFGGFSVPELFSHDLSALDRTQFNLNRATYILTGGYLIDLNNQFGLQPSFIARYNKETSIPSEISATLIFERKIWGGVTWRTNNDMIALLGWQLLPQLRAAYSFDYSMGETGPFNKGSHEISIQYDLRYKVHSPSIKFF